MADDRDTRRAFYAAMANAGWTPLADKDPKKSDLDFVWRYGDITCQIRPTEHGGVSLRIEGVCSRFTPLAQEGGGGFLATAHRLLDRLGIISKEGPSAEG